MRVDHGASSDLILTKQPDMSTFQVTPSKMKNSGSGPKYGHVAEAGGLEVRLGALGDAARGQRL
jgi:hypothetical protein